MRHSFLFVLALWAACLTTAAFASPAPPTRTVERLSLARERAVERGTASSTRSVKCAPSRAAYIYLCNFSGTNAGTRICAATYVHYRPGHTGRYAVNFWGQVWPCGMRAPIPPPSYPGDRGPSS